MATLLEAIRGQMSSIPKPAGATDETARLSEMMRAKSGRALPVSGGGTPRASNLQEQSANAQSSDAAQVIQASASATGAQLGVQEAAQASEHKLDMSAASAARKSTKQSYVDQTSKLMQELTQSGQQIDMQRDSAKLEQLGFTSRLANDLYVQELDQAAAENRLDDEHSFQQALANSVFDEQMDLLRTKLNYEELIAADANQFQELIEGMDVDFAVLISENRARAANSQAQTEAAGTAISAAASAYGSSTPSKTTTSAPKTQTTNVGGSASSMGTSNIA